MEGWHRGEEPLLIEVWKQRVGLCMHGRPCHLVTYPKMGYPKMGTGANFAAHHSWASKKSKKGTQLFSARNELRPSSVRHEICAKETRESGEGGRSCALNSKLP